MAEDKQYGSGSIVDIDRLTKLKAKVKAECLRRKYTGSVEAYGGTTYDFSSDPTASAVVKAEYYDKNATPLNAINSNSIPKANITEKSNAILNDEIYNMDYQVSTWMTTDPTNKDHTDCAVSCTGLCLSCTGSCTSGCSGTCSVICGWNCTGTCSGGCSGGCSGCGSGCSGGCSGTCSGNCKGTCSVACGNAGCSAKCAEGCSNGCSGTCTTSCGRCGTSCSGACTNSSTGATTTTNT